MRNCLGMQVGTTKSTFSAELLLMFYGLEVHNGIKAIRIMWGIHVLHFEVRVSVVAPKAFQYVINPQRPAIICSVA
jgi:hypothetical protein